MAAETGEHGAVSVRPEATGQSDAAPATPPCDPPAPRFPIVGVGASAGGLDAFRKLLETMPTDSGMAFVLVPHLSPTHDSLMVTLLARSTALPVAEAEEDMVVEANHVYVLPPNTYMTIGGGKLHLTGPVERGGLQTSIDLFLRSLAEDSQEQAIGIVLSGTGSHGTLGIQAIKAQGGMVMVQEPETAGFDGMPRSAIATGQADFILPPEHMAHALVQFTGRVYAPADQSADAVEELHLDQVLALLRTQAELDFRCYRKKTLLRRTRRRMGLNQIDRLPDYLAFLQAYPGEVKRLANDLLISVTSFFRDRDAFQVLETQVVPDLVGDRKADEALRVWVPGCATGEEAYSIAMLLLEQLAAGQKTCRLQLFATDVADDALDVARRGSYPDSITADVSPERLGRFFALKDGHSYQVNKQLREAVTFAAQNVLADPPFSKLDLISCRNLLIYLEPDVQQKLIGLFHFTLRDGGYLVLGPSETVGLKNDLFEPISRKWRVYRRVGIDRSQRMDFPIIGGGERPRAGRRLPTPEAAQPAEQPVPELGTTHGRPHDPAGELEGAYEDLKASSEEMMSMNEELQAANEELETSKEEMQSLNEELNTANSELSGKVGELRATAEHLRRLATVLIDSNDAVTVHDLRGRITAWNHGGERMFGYSEAEALHMNIEQLLPEELRPDADGLMKRLNGGERVDSLETRRLTKDGRIIDVWLTATLLRDDSGRINAVALTAHDVTDRKALETEVLEIAAGEQRRIGQDLHDTAGQELTALGLMADSLAAALADHAPAEAPLAAKIVQGLRRTLGQVRAMSRGLIPVEVSAHGLMAALADLAARIHGESGVKCAFACEDLVLVEDNSTATHLYRIAQEAVSNALKHGQAGHVEIGLAVAGDRLTLRVADDGVGMRAQGHVAAEGQGLRIMRYRADLIRASLSIESQAQSGTVVTCTLSEGANHART